MQLKNKLIRNIYYKEDIFKFLICCFMKIVILINKIEVYKNKFIIL